MNNLAIIPARSGSKGLKDKNIKLLNGKPLIAYSIEAAKKSEIYSHILVSTDSERYGEIAIQYGAEVPFYRSEENASDVASSWDVVKEVLKKYQEMGIVFDTFTLLQPTSPLRKYEDIKKAYELFKEKDAIAVVSVCEMEHSPLWSNTLPENNSLSGFLRADSNKQRQKLETFYRINGAIYMADVMSPSYPVCRIMTDVVCVLIGFITGGPLGIATIILMFGTGPLISTWNKLVSKPIVEKFA